jgi:hypothetical protein
MIDREHDCYAPAGQQEIDSCEGQYEEPQDDGSRDETKPARRRVEISE